jgi:hypothetical protein
MRPPGAAESKGQQIGRKMNIANKKFDFLRSTNIKALSQT